MVVAEPRDRAGHMDSARASWLSAIMLVGPLTLIAELLILKTHHRPLGAATFAVLSVISWGVAEVVSRRVLNPTISEARARARQIAWGLSIVLAVGVCARALFAS